MQYKTADKMIGNYPNPFNMSTSINFFLKDDARVRIDVYNIQGRRIRTLLNEHKTQGRHAVIWNGENAEGNVVSSGIYYYVIVTEDRMGKKESVTQQMLLIK